MKTRRVLSSTRGGMERDSLAQLAPIPAFAFVKFERVSRGSKAAIFTLSFGEHANSFARLVAIRLSRQAPFAIVILAHIVAWRDFRMSFWLRSLRKRSRVSKAIKVRHELHDKRRSGTFARASQNRLWVDRTVPWTSG
jgi:hypothetical protein